MERLADAEGEQIEVVDRERNEWTAYVDSVDYTPLGLKLGVTSKDSKSVEAFAEYAVEGSGLDFMDEYGDIVEAIARGEHEVVRELNDEEWPLFLDVLDEVQKLDVDEAELRAVQSEE